MHEMIYTSAPTTLEAPGLGVVAITPGMPHAVERIMRRLSRFDFFSLPDEQRSPPQFGIYSHVVVSDSGSNWHICTRTLSTGFDYTNRPNFLAHHLAFSDSEVPAGHSIFDVLEANDLFVDQWEGEPTSIEPRQLTLTTRAKKSNAWQSLIVGQDGCQQLMQSHASSQKAFLLDDSPLQILKLFKDAALSLGTQRANQVSFTTALGADVQGVTFDWIGIIRGTKFAGIVQTTAPEKVVDTQRKLESVALPTSTKVRAATKNPATEVGGLAQSKDAEDYLVKSQRNASSKLPPLSPPPPVSSLEDSLAPSPPLPPPQQSSDKLPIVICLATGALFLIAVALAVYVAFQWKASLNALAASQAALEVASKSAEQTAEELKQANVKLKALQSENGSLGVKWQEKFDEAVRDSRENAIGKENAEREAREAREALKKRLDGSNNKTTDPAQNENVPAVAVPPASLDRIACVDPDALLKNGSVQFSLEVPVESIKAASVLNLDGTPLNLPVTKQSVTLQAGGQVLDVTFDPVTNETPVADGRPLLQTTRLPLAAPATMTLTLRRAKTGEDFTALPTGTSIKFELTTPTPLPSVAVLYVVLHSLAAPIAHFKPNLEPCVLTAEQLKMHWTSFIVSQTAGPLFDREQANVSSIEGLQWASERLHLPSLGPRRQGAVDQFEGSSELNVGAAHQDGFMVGVINPTGFSPLQLWLVKRDVVPNFECSFGIPPKQTFWQKTLNDSVTLAGKVERRAKDKTTYPLIFFGLETDFRGVKFLKSSSLPAQSEANSGGTNAKR